LGGGDATFKGLKIAVPSPNLQQEIILTKMRTLLTSLLLTCVVIAQSAPLIVSCIGDSITYGSHSSNRTIASYPARLQQALGNAFNVTNFGHSGTTMMKHGDSPYWNTLEFQEFFKQSHVDIVVVMLGTNDAKDHNWNPNGPLSFEGDYQSFVDTVRHTFSNARILILVPPPAYSSHVADINPHTVNVLVPPVVRSVAFREKTEVVDVFNFMGGRALTHADWFAEGVHPNDIGYLQLGKYVAQAILAGPPATVTPVQDRKLNIICVGDSITAGVGSTDNSHAYPQVLQTLLGADFEVKNLGNSGRTMMKTADAPYWNTDSFQQLINANPKPDIVTIMLGTNDGKNHNWLANSTEEFYNDYVQFIKIVQSFSSKPIIHLLVPPPLYIEGVYDMNTTLINSYVHDLIPKIASATGVDYVSIYDALGGDELLHPEYISDGCHPTNLGYFQVAQKLGEVILADKTKLIQTASHVIGKTSYAVIQ
jgi:lysophospholipase L1-like esterase